MAPSVLWFRRDLRLADHPALLAAAADGTVLPLFVLDDALRGPAGAPRLAFLYRCLRTLAADTDGALVITTGRPEDVVPRVAREIGAARVHVSADFAPYGARRDAAVEAALAADGRALVRTGSPYAVSPGRITRGGSGSSGATGFKVYSPYFRAWQAHGVRPPAERPATVPWLRTGAVRSEEVPPDPDLGPVALPEAGEAAGLAAWAAYRAARLSAYAESRDLPGAQGGTSQLSVHLKYGTVHPRTLLADLGDGEGEASFRGELAWRDFYADVLWRRPESAREPLQPAMARLEVDSGPVADQRFAAWVDGRTGYPIVDAGMRQLATEAWMHNRVRMIVGSFLVKDLHLPWQRGTKLFMERLRDGDLASNAHGWQWIAGTGTDPAPFFRIFNPTTQGQKFDASGDYIRRYVPELRDVPAGLVHEPWRLPGGPPAGYPSPMVDHRAERAEALRRYAAVKDG